MDVTTLLRSLGGVAQRSVLLNAGATGPQVERALAAGAIFRVRRAWYGVPDAPATVVRAVRVGGSLTSVSAASATAS